MAGVSQVKVHFASARIEVDHHPETVSGRSHRRHRQGRLHGAGIGVLTRRSGPQHGPLISLTAACRLAAACLFFDLRP